MGGRCQDVDSGYVFAGWHYVDPTSLPARLHVFLLQEHTGTSLEKQDDVRTDNYLPDLTIACPPATFMALHVEVLLLLFVLTIYMHVEIGDDIVSPA